MLFLSHPLECQMFFGSRITYLNVLILCCYISSRATLAKVFTDKALRYSDQDAIAMRKHCHHHKDLVQKFKMLVFIDHYYYYYYNYFNHHHHHY